MRSEVVLELDSSTQAVLRSGRVVAGRGMQRDVDWGAGEVQVVSLGRDGTVMRLAMTAGGLRHLAKVGRPAVEELLAKVPHVVFAMALRDVPKASPSKVLIDEVDGLFPGRDASAAWKRSRQAFETRSDVEVKGRGSKLRYVWTSCGDDVIDSLAGVTVSESDAPFDIDQTVDSHEDDPSVGSEGDRGLNGSEPGSTSHGDTKSKPARESVSDSTPPSKRGDALATGAAEVTPASSSKHGEESVDRTDWIAGLRRLSKGGVSPSDAHGLEAYAGSIGPAMTLVYAALVGGGSDERRAQALAGSLSEPLKAGRQLADLPNDVLTAAAERLTGNEQIVLALIPRRLKAAEAIDPIARLGPDPATSLLLSVLAAISSVPTGKRESGDDEYAVVCRRFMDHQSARQLTPAQVLEVTTPLTQGSDPEAASWFGELVLGALERASHPFAVVSLRERQDIARRLSAAPLTRASARARLLTWIWVNDRAEARNLRWWQGADVESLGDIGTGPLAAALEDPDLTSTVVLPIVQEALSAAHTRRQLFALLAAPRPLLNAVDAHEVGGALRRVLGSDELARPWLADVGQAARLEAVESENGGLRDTVRLLEQQLLAVRGEASQARERALRLEQRMTEAGEASGKVRESQTRQAQLEALRALAGLASYVVESLADGRDVQRIAQRVQSLVSREGLTPIGSVGEEVSYLPVDHELVGADQSVESPVIVTALGYKVTEPDGGALVLLKAIVTPRN